MSVFYYSRDTLFYDLVSVCEYLRSSGMCVW